MANEITATLVGYTKPILDAATTPGELIAYCARVSNPHNQANHSTAAGLLRYCMEHGHWSVFEMANCVIEVQAPRDITRQIIRHRSFSFQEFSQRYAAQQNFTLRECRLQDTKNRQSSLANEDPVLEEWWRDRQRTLLNHATQIYEEGLSRGIAKEVARVVLPEGLSMSRIYMNGTLRSWLHYLQVRRDPATQKEHRQVAEQCYSIIESILPSAFVSPGA